MGWQEKSKKIIKFKFTKNTVDIINNTNKPYIIENTFYQTRQTREKKTAAR